jgi:hypothetical protein
MSTILKLFSYLNDALRILSSFLAVYEYFKDKKGSLKTPKKRRGKKREKKKE